jgi:hypothetical protein
LLFFLSHNHPAPLLPHKCDLPPLILWPAIRSVRPQGATFQGSASPLSPFPPFLSRTAQLSNARSDAVRVLLAVWSAGVALSPKCVRFFLSGSEWKWNGGRNFEKLGEAWKNCCDGGVLWAA